MVGAFWIRSPEPRARDSKTKQGSWSVQEDGMGRFLHLPPRSGPLPSLWVVHANMTLISTLPFSFFFSFSFFTIELLLFSANPFSFSFLNFNFFLEGGEFIHTFISLSLTYERESSTFPLVPSHTRSLFPIFLLCIFVFSYALK